MLRPRESFSVHVVCSNFTQVIPYPVNSYLDFVLSLFNGNLYPAELVLLFSEEKSNSLILHQRAALVIQSHWDVNEEIHDFIFKCLANVLFCIKMIIDKGHQKCKGLEFDSTCHCSMLQISTSMTQ